MLWKMPPKEKIYEAWSAVADGRVKISGNSAKIKSSNYSKEYTVMWKDDVWSSNDNASYWQGYYGYPVIAVLILKEELPYDEGTAQLFRGIDWKSLNAAHKRNYSAAASEILLNLKANGADCEKITAQAAKTYDELRKLNIKRARALK